MDSFFADDFCVVELDTPEPDLPDFKKYLDDLGIMCRPVKNMAWRYMARRDILQSMISVWWEDDQLCDYIQRASSPYIMPRLPALAANSTLVSVMYSDGSIHSVPEQYTKAAELFKDPVPMAFQLSTIDEPTPLLGYCPKAVEMRDGIKPFTRGDAFRKWLTACGFVYNYFDRKIFVHMDTDMVDIFYEVPWRMGKYAIDDLVWLKHWQWKQAGVIEELV